MPTTEQPTDIVDRVRQRLAEAERDGIYLKVVGHKLDDEWLYIVGGAVPAGRACVRTRRLHVEGRARASRAGG